ncbi:MAG: glycosyltransferase family 4 protein [Candidatus Woesearchaeota archaeon]
MGYNLHYINHALMPDIMANIIARKNMANSFARLSEIRKVHFYFIVNDMKNVKKIKEDLEKNVVLHPIYVPSYRIQSGNNIGFKQKILQKFMFIKFLREILKQKPGKNDIIFIRGWGGLLSLLLINIFRKLPYSLELHNYEFGSSFVQDFFYKSFMKKARKIVTISEFTKKNWVKMGIHDDKIMVLPSGVDLKKFKNITKSKKELRKELGLPYDKKIVLYSGQLHYWKGVEVLIDAFGLIDDKKVWLYMLGGYKKDIDKYKKYAQKKGVERTIFLGNKDHKEVPSYLKSADLLVLPNSGKYRKSSLHTSPIKLFEYMASGVPVIASDLKSIRQVVSEKEVTFFRADDEKELAEKIKEILNKKTNSARTDNAFKRSHEFTWDKRAKKVFEKIR